MRGLLILILLGGLLYSGYWVVTVRTLEEATEARLVAARAEGWRIEIDEMETSGFPSRFDTFVEGVEVATPDGRFYWQAPFFQVFALAYRPTEVIAAFPTEQQICVGNLCVDVVSERMRASATVADLDGRIEAATVEGEAIEVGREGETLLAADSLLGALREVADRENAQDGYLRLGGTTVSPGLVGPGLPEVPADVVVDARLGLTGPLGPVPVEVDWIELRLLELRWGELQLSAGGELTVLPDGTPEGLLMLRSPDVDAWLEALGAAGLVADQGLGLARGMLAAMTGPDGVTELPLSFARGGMQLGPIPLGPAPLLR